MKKIKDTYAKGTRVEICYYPELPNKTGTIINTYHDFNIYRHAEWVKLKLDDGTIKCLPVCFIRT